MIPERKQDVMEGKDVSGHCCPHFYFCLVTFFQYILR